MAACAGAAGCAGAVALAAGADGGAAPQLQTTKAQLQGAASAPGGEEGPSGGSTGGTKPKLHTSWSEEEREQHASIMAHQQALRRATHLRQRKISTELKLETIQKQLRRAKKTQPKAIPEEGNDRLAFEEQLQELTETLKTLEGNLGQTELEAQKTKRNWDSKMEEVYKHIYDPATILNIDQWAERKNTSGGRGSTRRIGGGSLRVRAAKFMQSPRPKKKPHDTNNKDNTTTIEKHTTAGGGSNVEDSDTDEKSSGARTLGGKQGRRGTFRVFGSLLDSKRGRFGGSGKQMKDGRGINNISSSQKHKSDATSNSSIEQEKENIEKQETDGQSSSNHESNRMTTAAGGQDNTTGNKEAGKAQQLDSIISARPEIPRWVLDEIELFEQLIRDYQKVHGKAVDLFET